MRSLTWLVLLLVASVFATLRTANSQVVQFKYTGTIPAGASSNSMVADGEVFTAIFDVDTSVADTDADNNEGLYVAAVLSGSLSFSGGHLSNEDFSGINVNVADNLFGLDGVQVSPTQSTSLWISAASEDLLTLQSDAIPSVGTTFLSDVTNFNTGGLAFSYSDTFGNISYTWAAGADTTFMVTSVPEPGHFVFTGVLFAVFAGNRRRT
jgi:hypothetical protein